MSIFCQPATRLVLLSGVASLCLLLAACEPSIPPTQRTASTIPYTGTGNAQQGKLLYETECLKCHTLTVGNSKKGPQLKGIYGAKSAELAEYQHRYSGALKQAHWTWDTPTLDRYIAHPSNTLAGTKMLYDGLNNAQHRADIIAYLASLNPKTAVKR